MCTPRAGQSYRMDANMIITMNKLIIIAAIITIIITLIIIVIIIMIASRKLIIRVRVRVKSK